MQTIWGAVGKKQSIGVLIQTYDGAAVLRVFIDDARVVGS